MKRNRNAAPSESTPSITDLIVQLEGLVAEAESVRQATKSGEDVEAEGRWAGLRARYRGLKYDFETLCADARERLVTSARSADEAVRSHPYEGMAIAAGLGVLLGAWIRRR